MEIWIPIENWPWYEASNLGRIRSMDRILIHKNGKRHPYPSKVLKPWIHKSGHLYVQVSNDFILRDHQSVHILVCSTFHGECPEGKECRHLDGNPKNNTPDNLMWGTHKENIDDASRQGRMKGGDPTNPEIKEKFKQSALKRWSNPEEREKQSERVKKLWRDGKYSK